MAIIELKGTALNYSAGLGAFDTLNTAWTSAMRSSTSLHDAIETLQLQINVAASITSVGTAQELVQKAEGRETEKQSALTLAYEKLDTLIMETAVVDQRVADVINTLQADFYKNYPYLEPDNWLEEFCGDIVNGWNNFWDGIGSAIAECIHDVVEWCKEHWREILTTIVIVVSAILAIAAVIATGGMALVPILTVALTTIGVSAGTAMTIATIASLTIATIAVLSTVGSATLNMIDTWCEIDNPTFNSFQTALNFASFLSNGIYSIGSIYNGIKGISNADLRNYGRAWRTSSQFRSAVSGASKYNFTLEPNSSTFWSGIGDKGLGNGDQIAANCAERMGRTTLENTLSSNGIELPTWDASNPASINAWNSASSSFAMHSSGDVSALLGQTVREKSVWNVFERIILGVNSNVGNITLYTPTTVNVIVRSPQIGSLLSGIFTMVFQTGTLLNDWN